MSSYGTSIVLENFNSKIKIPSWAQSMYVLIPNITICDLSVSLFSKEYECIRPKDLDGEDNLKVGCTGGDGDKYKAFWYDIGRGFDHLQVSTSVAQEAQLGIIFRD